MVWLLRPKFVVSVWALILDEHRRVLLLKHTHTGARPWGLPRGCVEKAEGLADAVRREVLEETGWVIEPVSLLAAELEPPLSELRLAYLCRIVGGSFRPTAEVEDFAFFGAAQLPPGVRPLQVQIIRRACEESQ